MEVRYTPTSLLAGGFANCFASHVCACVVPAFFAAASLFLLLLVSPCVDVLSLLPAWSGQNILFHDLGTWIQTALFTYRSFLLFSQGEHMFITSMAQHTSIQHTAQARSRKANRETRSSHAATCQSTRTRAMKHFGRHSSPIANNTALSISLS